MMYLKWITPFLFLGLMGQAFANPIDSLKNELTEATPQAKGEIYYELGRAFWKKRDYPATQKNLNLAIHFFAQAQNHQGVNDAYFILGRSYFEEAKYDQAIQSFTTAKDYALAHHRKKDAANEYNAIGITNKSIGKFPEAVRAFQASLKIYTDLNFEEGMAAANHNLGMIYRKIAKLDTALVHYQYALNLREKSGSDSEVGHYLQSIANIYLDLKNDKQAFDFAQKSIARFERAKDSTGLINAYGVLGLIYLDQHNFAQAEKTLQYILPIAEHYKYNLPNTYMSLGKVYQGLGAHQKALTFFDKALKNSHFSESGNIKSEILLAISESYEKLNQPAQALLYYRSYIAVKDSIEGLAVKKQIEELTAQYQSELKDRKIALLAKDKKMSRAIIFGILAISLLLGVVSWLYFRTKRLQATQHNLELEQRLLRAQIKPHFLFNALTAIQSFTLKNGIEAGAVYLSSFAKLMRSILESSSQEYVPLADELESIEHYLRLEKLRHGHLFDYHISCDPTISQEKVFVPPMLMQPFLENAIKHGFSGKKEGGHIDIKVDKIDQQIQFTIKDNGVGIDSQTQNIHKHNSRSIQITKDRLEVLNKKLRKNIVLVVEDVSKKNQDTKGTRVTFRLPIISDV